jgi:glycerophosphoryl diester phosphodiesterase
MARTAFFDGPLPRILAHRGLTTHAAENSLEAFGAALAAGATHLETDARATADGAAVLVHDRRVAGAGPAVERLTLAELRERLPSACTLDEALARFPDARFNIDVKHVGAAAPVARAVTSADAAGRVLLASFRGSRRRVALAAVPGAATSASSGAVAGMLLGVGLRAQGVVRAALAGVDAVQIPARSERLATVGAALIRAVHDAGAEVHYWVVNDPHRMRELVALGADGIVTDRPDLAADALR